MARLAFHLSNVHMCGYTCKGKTGKSLWWHRNHTVVSLNLNITGDTWFWGGQYILSKRTGFLEKCVCPDTLPWLAGRSIFLQLHANIGHHKLFLGQSLLLSTIILNDILYSGFFVGENFCEFHKSISIHENFTLKMFTKTFITKCS